MQFTTGGPDVPDRLLQAHEDGRVAFFCGAGISYPAGLPGFKGLVMALYRDQHFEPAAEHIAAIKAGRYDTAIGLLEKDLLDGRQTVRKAVERILTPRIKTPNATATHQALLTLGKTRKGLTRLITTNFDRLFEHVIRTTSPELTRFCAPLLPVPKKRWDGLVYLHGRLAENPSPSDLERLVLSSGDFGLAYLTERWASRFVSELFRNYTVCFVGYSLDDPVLRYMTDALSADRLMGESTREMFAFAVYSRGKEADQSQAWGAKGVTPILYSAHWRHACLHRTLHHWSETYRDGARGKKRIVVECATANPRASLKQDDSVSRMLWALSDASGLPAKRFAELDPVPSLDWLEPLSDARFRYPDLERFGVQPDRDVDANLAFSLTQRPSPYHLAPWMTLDDAGGSAGQWDNIMQHLAHWLTRHLDDSVLLLQLAKLGGRVHENLASQIEQRIRHLMDLESQGNASELSRIRASAPSAIPRAPMRTLWRFLLTGRVRSNIHNHDLHTWKDQFVRYGLTPTLRLELREMLTPRITLNEAHTWPLESDDIERPERVSDLVDWKIVLSTDMVQHHLGDLPNDDRWKAAMPELLSDFNALLRDVLDLMRELGGADDRTDLSYVHQPSISQHPQNRGFHDWTALIDFVREAWLATSISSPDRAEVVAEAWWQTPYPLFRRLAMFAATQNSIIRPNRALAWMLEDESWWLWSVESSRESIRLLVSLAPRLDAKQFAQLEQAILAGAPPTMYKSDIESELTEIQDREIWLRLARVVETGAQLNEEAQQRLRSLSSQNPEWKLAEDQRDEFSGWISVSNESQQSVATPHGTAELVTWLKENPAPDSWRKDDWSDRCRNDFDAVASALTELAQGGIWPARRWGQAFHVWSEGELAQDAWHRVAPVLEQGPPEHLQGLSHDLSLWLRKMAETFQGQESVFFGLCDGLLALDYEPAADTDDVVGRAINHPVGRVAEALLEYWYTGSLEDEQGLRDEFRERFSILCDQEAPSFRHGRVLLAAHVISLFRVDRVWAIEHLLPLFDWSESEPEARLAWGGFLWSPQLYRPFVEELKREFLDTASHYEALGQFKEQYAALLTFAALDSGDIFRSAELAEATHALPQDGLEAAAEALVRAIEGTGNQRVPYWRNRVEPYLRTIWPKTGERATPSIAEPFSRVSIAAGNAFPDALGVVLPWLQPVQNEYRVVHSLHESGLCRQFPRAALDLLDRVIRIEDSWPSDELAECLRAIRTAERALGGDSRFVRLREDLARCGRDL